MTIANRSTTTDAKLVLLAYFPATGVAIKQAYPPLISANYCGGPTGCGSLEDTRVYPLVDLYSILLR
ncbi:hypothetical protein [Achromobacter marplatensis]|uniref:hypothetical protein n=1 Tax=Achromobacter marplatensis TaxID=470868 RepID=UPI003C74D19E